MKKLISIFLCLTLLLSLSIVAQAYTETEHEQQTVEVSLELDPTMETYTLEIPSTVTIDPASKSGTMNYSLSDINLIWSDNIWLSVKAKNAAMVEENDYSRSSCLVNNETGEMIGYLLKDDDGKIYTGEEMETGSYLTVFKRDDNSLVGSLEFTISENQAFPGIGTFSDTLTFTVSTVQFTGH